MPIASDFPPRLMPAPAAARYIGVSVSTLNALRLPRKELGAKRLYDKADLDAYADGLPYEGELAEVNTCDGVFG
ncbi:MAG: DNA-binding protein [Planktomarina sp.]